MPRSAIGDRQPDQQRHHERPTGADATAQDGHKGGLAHAETGGRDDHHDAEGARRGVTTDRKWQQLEPAAQREGERVRGETLRDPPERRQATSHEKATGGQRVIHRRTPQHPESPSEEPVQHRGAGHHQADEETGDDHPPPAVTGDGEREQRPSHHQSADQSQSDRHDRRRRRPSPGHVVIASQFHLSQHRPHASRQVLAELSHEIHPRSSHDR